MTEGNANKLLRFVRQTISSDDSPENSLKLPKTTIESSLDVRLRPQSLDQVVGQDAVKSTLNVFIESARRRFTTLDHVMLAGPAGLGKTTIGNVIAQELGNEFIMFHGPQVDSAVVWKLASGALSEAEVTYLVFIDEIHAVEKSVFTLLLPLIEEFRLGDQLVHPFTLVGATTIPSKLPKPLRDRFGISYQLDYYPVEELAEIIGRSFNAMAPDTPIEDGAIESLAQRSRGTPRIANRLLRRALDYHWVGTDAIFNRSTVQRAMTALSIDRHGLDQHDRSILRTMFERFPNRPAGINAIASAVGEDGKELEAVTEPWLVREGFINREQRGRTLTTKGLVVAGLESEGKAEF